jgi:lactate permease
LVVAGGSFALFQLTFSHSRSLFPMTDIGGGIFSLAFTALFLRFVWKPKEEWHFDKGKEMDDRAEGAEAAKTSAKAPQGEMPLFDDPKKQVSDPPLTLRRIAIAWMPFALMSLLLLASGVLRQVEGKWINEFNQTGTPLPTFAGVQTVYLINVPGLHKLSTRAEELQSPERVGEAETAVYRFEYLSSPGTPVFLSAILSMLLLRMNRRQVGRALRVTIRQMRIPIPTIALMIGLSYVTRFAGMDGTLGYAFSLTGRAYPFFAALLGWLGVFLTGTDAGSNALFGSLQKIVADRIHQFTQLTQDQAQILICTTNSTGGVMGKMIDAQSICVATAATHQLGREADIFKAVFWHSLALASIVGLIALLQAYVYPFTLMVPHLPGK